MQTSQLHMIPLANACAKVSDVLAEAMPIAVPGLAITPPCTAKNTSKSDLPRRDNRKTNSQVIRAFATHIRSCQLSVAVDTAAATKHQRRSQSKSIAWWPPLPILKKSHRWTFGKSSWTKSIREIPQKRSGGKSATTFAAVPFPPVIAYNTSMQALVATKDHVAIWDALVKLASWRTRRNFRGRSRSSS